MNYFISFQWDAFNFKPASNCWFQKVLQGVRTADDILMQEYLFYVAS